MYQVEVHSFNEGGRYHYNHFSEDNDGAGREEYVNKCIKEYIDIGYKEDGFKFRPEEQRYSLIKEEKWMTSYVDIIIRKIVPNVEYSYED